MHVFVQGFFIPFFLASNIDYPLVNLNSFNILQAAEFLLDLVGTWTDTQTWS